MRLYSRAGLAIILLATLTAVGAQPTPLRLIRSLSGPSGKVVGAKFVFDETRSRFVFPQDKALTIFFEFEAPPGDHALSGIWKSPDGKTYSISQDVRIQTTTPELNAYWSFELYPSLPSGIWTLEVRVDGQPGGSHQFELVIPGGPTGSVPLSIEQVYKSTLPSMVWIHRLDATGRRVDTGSGFVIGKDRIATAFQIIDSAAGLEVEFAGGRIVKTDQIWNANRLEDWALIRADTLEVPALERDVSKASYIGERLTVFNVETGLVRAIGGVDVTGRQKESLFGERIQISPSTSFESVGGPLLTPSGKVTGILGGSMLPGSRVPPDGIFRLNTPAWTSLSRVSVTPFALVPETGTETPVSLKTLTDTGALCAPITTFATFLYGGTTIKLPSDPSAPAPRDVSDFSRKDPAVAVYTFWQKKDKKAKGTIGAKVYDIQNHVLVTIPPKKATIFQDFPSRSSFSVVPGSLNKGVYRVDVLWQDQVVWRTFFRIVD
jgi:Trypsin-like peptidase domain